MEEGRRSLMLVVLLPVLSTLMLLRQALDLAV